MAGSDNPFEATLDRLRAKGWIKECWGPPEGPNCISGAAAHVTGKAYPEVTNILADLARFEYPDRTGGGFDHISFNNHPDTTFADVERVLEKAAIKWEEERVLRHD